MIVDANYPSNESTNRFQELENQNIFEKVPRNNMTYFFTNPTVTNNAAYVTIMFLQTFIITIMLLFLIQIIYENNSLKKALFQLSGQETQLHPIIRQNQSSFRNSEIQENVDENNTRRTKVESVPSNKVKRTQYEH